MTPMSQMVRLYRENLGLSLREAADRIGISTSALNRIEKSATGMNASTFLTFSAWALRPRAGNHRIRR